MRLKTEQLGGALKNLAAVYMVSGDEPLQLGESADAIRKAAKEAGYNHSDFYTGEWFEIIPVMLR